MQDIDDARELTIYIIYIAFASLKEMKNMPPISLNVSMQKWKAFMSQKPVTTWLVADMKMSIASHEA